MQTFTVIPVRVVLHFRVIFSSVESTSRNDVSEENNFAYTAYKFAMSASVSTGQKESRLIFGAELAACFPPHFSLTRVRKERITYFISHARNPFLIHIFRSIASALFAVHYVSVDRKTNGRTSP